MEKKEELQEIKIQAIPIDEIHKEINEFKKFAFRSNMIQTAVAFMLGAAFTKFISSLSENIVMPLINYSIGQIETSWKKVNFEIIPGLTLETGKFLASFVDFLVISTILYVVYVKIMKGADIKSIQ